MVRRASRSTKQRGGFTLLEVLLSSAIGVMLLGGLYVAVEVQYRQIHAGQQAGKQATLAARLLSNIARDISGELAPTLSTSVTNAGSGSSASGSGAGSTASGSSTATATASNVVQFNNGVLGDAQTLIITSSRVPKETLRPEILNSGTQIYGTSDVRRIMYWIAQGDGGLARFELKTVTDPTQLAYCALPPAVPDEANYIVAPEVKSIQFTYFDGTNWNDTWDGSQPSQLANSDGVTPQGPPLAIAVVIGIQTDENDPQNSSAANTNLGGNANLKMYRRVIAIPTANGLTITPAASTTGQ
jgi:prepilin-type N-terminal cleavage/methylation domain-containing protein